MDKKKADLINIVKPLALFTHPCKDMAERDWFQRLYKWSGMGTAEELCVDFASLEIAELFYIWNKLLETQINRYNKAAEKLNFHMEGIPIDEK